MASAAQQLASISRRRLAEALGADLVAERQAPDHPLRGAVPALRARLLAEQGWLLSSELYLRRQNLQLRFSQPRAWLLLILQGTLALDRDGRDHPLLLDARGQRLCLSHAASQEFTILQAPVQLLRLALPPSVRWSCGDISAAASLPLLEPLLQVLHQADHDRAPQETRVRLLEALQSYCLTELEPLGVQLQIQEQDPLQKLLDWLQTHHGEELQLADLATVANLSGRRLQELCHQRFGFSPMELLRQQRLEALHRQLLDPTHAGVGLGQLLRRCRLPDSTATRQGFQQRYGQTPAALRKQALAAGARRS